MSDWQVRFRNLGKQASQQIETKRKEMCDIEENKKWIKKERKLVVNELGPQIEEVCKDFARSLKWKHSTTWRRFETDVHFELTWKWTAPKSGLTKDICSILGNTTPLLPEKEDNKPALPIKGIWIWCARHVEKPQWTTVTDYDGKQEVESCGFYWQGFEYRVQILVGPVGYFLPLCEFTKERFAAIIEELYNHCAPDRTLYP